MSVTSSGGFTAPTLRWAGPQAFLLECASLADVMTLHAHLIAHPYPGQREAIAAAETVLLVFRTRGEAVAAARQVTTVTPEARDDEAARVVTVDVLYDGEDLADVAALTGMSIDAVIDAHTSTEYVGAFGGFAPGFTYCAAEPAPFDVPRRSSPRTAVPAGSVGLAGRFSAVYPRISPGGWQLLGRTDAVLWDIDREAPALIRPGDRVRYRAVRELAVVTTPTPSRADADHTEDADQVDAAGSLADADAPGLHVEATGLQALIQDLGRHGHGDLGVTASGAADRTAARQANRLVGNSSSEAVIEALLGGLSVTAHGDHVLALAGAEARATITSPAHVRTAPVRRPFALLDGETLTLEEPAAGMRAYLAVRGGIEVEAPLGSRATDVMSGIGPDPLAPGMFVPRRVDPGHRLVGDAEPPVRRTPTAHGLTTLRVVLGPRQDWFDADSLERFTAQQWTVTAESNRIGVRLRAPDDGAPLTRAKDGELASEGVFTGALQVPPSGEPVLFLADHPVTGGYPVVAVVVPEDLGTAAQLPPGARVRFTTVDADDDHSGPADPADPADLAQTATANRPAASEASPTPQTSSSAQPAPTTSPAQTEEA